MAPGTTKMTYRFLTILLVLCVFGLSVGATDVDDAEDDDRYERCISLRSVRSTDVVNDNLIVFRTVGGEVFLNEFTRTCRGLSRERRFTYDSHMRRLCAGDSIRVLMEGGVSMYEGASCRLGEFRLLTERELEEIYPSRIDVPGPEEVEPAEVEELDTHETIQDK